jgi:hypothetical protein
MFSRRQGFLLLCFYLLPVGAGAQPHHNIWLRGTVSANLNKQWKVGLELQHRRQDMTGKNNPFAYDLMYSARPWLYYQFSSNVRFECAPISFFRLSMPVNGSADINKLPQLELRSTIALQASRPVWNDLTLSIRPALEYRALMHHSDLLRFRTKFQLQHQIKSYLMIYGYEEILLHLAGLPLSHLLDQNRLCAALQWKPGIHASFEAGYVYLSRLPATSDDLIAEHNFFVQFSYLIK